MASATSSRKKYLSTYFFPLSISYFIKKMTQTSSKKRDYRWTTSAEEAFVSVLTKAVKMRLRPETGFKAVIF
jgi:hypothetical protein